MYLQKKPQGTEKEKSLIKICTRDSCTFQLLREQRSVSLITGENEIDLSAVETFIEGQALGVISHQEDEVNTVFNLVCEVCKWYNAITLSEHMETCWGIIFFAIWLSTWISKSSKRSYFGDYLTVAPLIWGLGIFYQEKMLSRNIHNEWKSPPKVEIRGHRSQVRKCTWMKTPISSALWKHIGDMPVLFSQFPPEKPSEWELFNYNNSSCSYYVYKLVVYSQSCCKVPPKF